MFDGRSPVRRERLKGNRAGSSWNRSQGERVGRWRDEPWPPGTTPPAGVDGQKEGNRLLRFHQELPPDSQARTWVVTQVIPHDIPALGEMNASSQMNVTSVS